jgi:hypothetical protein
MRDKSAHDLVVRAVDVGAVTNRMIPAVLKEWREPSYPEFVDRTGWSLFNAFTEVVKGNLPELAGDGMATWVGCLRWALLILAFAISMFFLLAVYSS